MSGARELGAWFCPVCGAYCPDTPTLLAHVAGPACIALYEASGGATWRAGWNCCDGTTVLDGFAVLEAARRLRELLRLPVGADALPEPDDAPAGQPGASAAVPKAKGDPA